MTPDPTPPPAPYRYFAASNLLSYASLASAWAALGLLASAPSLGKGRAFAAAAAALLASFVCDLFDGRFARLFPRREDEKRFGEQIDSLVDVVAFGFVPASLVFFASPGPPAAISKAAAVYYSLCVLTRLAFYNVHSAGTPWFTGLPCPMGQFVWAMVLIWPNTASHPTILAAAYIGLGTLMVAPLRIPRPGLRGLAVLAALALALVTIAIRRFFETSA